MPDAASTQFTANPLRWLPEFLLLSHPRLRTQSRLLGAAVLVGVVAGLGAIVFHLACLVVIRYGLDAVAGYRPPGPAGESAPAWFGESDTPFRPWLLLVVPAVGGLISGVIVFTLAPEAEGTGPTPSSTRITAGTA
jgi:H+/Cl- antiporter ClcA